MTQIRALAIGVVAVLVASACGSHPTPAGGGPVASPVPVHSCVTAHFPFPPAAANLTAADSGRTIMVQVGDLIAVTLLGSQAPNRRWPEISVSGASLQPLVNTANAATVGTQLGEYCAVRPGATTVTSATWHATVDVR